MTTPSLTTEVAAARIGPSKRFDARERKLLECVKDYVDSLSGVSALSLTSGDLLVSDGTTWVNKALSGDATIDSDGVLTLAADAVDNANLADDSVSLEQLDSGVAPSHVVKFAGKFTTVGGAASEDQTLAGVLATDVVIYSLQDVGNTPCTIITGKPGTDKITWTFSDDPSNDHIVAYQVLRAAT